MIDWLAPLTEAGWLITLHASTAMLSLLLGVFILARPKGSLAHRALGYAWLAGMALAVLSSLFISQIRLWGALQPHPPAVGIHDFLAPLRLARGAASRPANPQDHHDRDVSRGAGPELLVHSAAWTGYARAVFWPHLITPDPPVNDEPDDP